MVILILLTLGRLPISEEFHQKISQCDDFEDLSLAYIIPTTADEGACTTALVDFLVIAHNSFIDRCRGIISDKNDRYELIDTQTCVYATLLHIACSIINLY